MMSKPEDEQAQGRTDLGMNTVRCQRLRVSLRQYNTIANIIKKNNSIPMVHAPVQGILILRC